MDIFSMQDGVIPMDDVAIGDGSNPAQGAPEMGAQLLVDGESRRIFLNQGYPWALNGKITTENNGGEGSGIMIGKNLVLTALHCVNSKGLKQYFIPACYADPPPGSRAEPFGRFEVVNSYRWIDVNFSGTGANEEGVADYAVLKLAAEPNVGWAGTHGQADRGWIDRKMWYHVGYPVNNVHKLANHRNGRPSFEMDIAIKTIRDYTYVNKAGLKLDGTKFFTTADCEGGQSGGALFNIIDKNVMVAGVLAQVAPPGVLAQDGPHGPDSGFAACHPNLGKLVAWCRQNA